MQNQVYFKFPYLHINNQHFIASNLINQSKDFEVLSMDKLFLALTNLFISFNKLSYLKKKNGFNT